MLGKARISLDKLSENGVLVKYGGAARHKQLLAGTGHGDIEFTVDGASVLIEAVGTEEVELIRVADGERVDDNVALRALIAFDGVDADIEKLGNSQLSYLTTNHSNLVAIGHDDANSLCRIETLSVLTINATKEVGNKAGLSGVDFIRGERGEGRSERGG